MATSSCVKCGSTSFELKETNVTGSKFKLDFIQCSSCGGVVGVKDYHNTAYLIELLGKKLGVKLFEPL